MPKTVEFFGESFDLNDSVSEFALMEFSLAADEGQDGDTRQGLASILRLVRECVAPGEWVRFRDTARKNRAGAEDLVPILTATFQQETGRPTGGSSDSSDGPNATPQKSGSSSGDKVAEMFPGRPDKQLGILRSASA